MMTASESAIAFCERELERISEGGKLSKYDYTYTIGAITAYMVIGIISVEQADELKERAYDALTKI
jgi:hypothetical protein